ncbi:unnamed protein product [Peronospora effusa]|uniref:Uncharacterized protein n=1 Tax=Peronospora effusa TaxID=542832 RepID=A0A3R7Y1A8_9STRA|nr:hypothetical protein DD237_008354 [Peronospora effusa]CAI5705681.1 unnamed protein product [Peronospora effusa]
MDNIRREYAPIPLTLDTINDFSSTLRGTSYHKDVGSTRVCWSDVVSVYYINLSGNGFLFNINGCNVTLSEGQCSDTILASCTPTAFHVKIHDDWNTDAHVISDITDVAPTAGSCHPIPTDPTVPNNAKNPMCSCQQPSPEEKNLFDHWLKAQGLDQDSTPSLARSPRNINGCSPYEVFKMAYSNHPWLPSAVVQPRDCEKVEMPTIVQWYYNTGLDGYGQPIEAKKPPPLVYDIYSKKSAPANICISARLTWCPEFPWFEKKLTTA